MAIIQCEECGQMISDQAGRCPRCGCPITKTVVCPECGQMVSSPSGICPVCGCPLTVPQPKKKKGNSIVLSIIFIIAIAMGATLGIWFWAWKLTMKSDEREMTSHIEKISDSPNPDEDGFYDNQYYDNIDNLQSPAETVDENPSADETSPPTNAESKQDDGQEWLPDGYYQYEGSWDAVEFESQPCVLEFTRRNGRISGTYTNLKYNYSNTISGRIDGTTLMLSGICNNQRLEINLLLDDGLDYLTGYSKHGNVFATVTLHRTN